MDQAIAKIDGLKVRSPEVEVFWRWVNNANPGERYVYFDKILPEGVPLRDPEKGVGVPVAQAAWEAYELGLVDLLQQRVSREERRTTHGTIGRFEYIAQKRKPT